MEKFVPSKELRKKILQSITEEEGYRARKYLLISFSTALVSFAGVILSVQYVLDVVYQTSFYKYFSLLFSDSDVVVSYWREFSLSLIESMPFLSITLVLATIVALMASVRVLATSTKHGYSFSL